MLKLKTNSVILIIGLVILTRLFYYYGMQGIHKPLYYIKINNIKDILQLLIFAFAVSVNFKAIRGHMLALIIAFDTYCLLLSLILLYPFIHGSTRILMMNIYSWYNIIVLGVSFLIGLYIIFCHLAKVLKS